MTIILTLHFILLLSCLLLKVSLTRSFIISYFFILLVLLQLNKPPILYHVAFYFPYPYFFLFSLLISEITMEHNLSINSFQATISLSLIFTLIQSQIRVNSRSGSFPATSLKLQTLYVSFAWRRVTQGNCDSALLVMWMNG